MQDEARTVRWHTRFASGQREGWRSRIGMVLRRLADRLDRRVSLAIEMRGTPRVAPAVKARVLRCGLRYMDGLFREATRAEAEEIAFRKSNLPAIRFRR